MLDANNIKVFVDRTINPNTLNSTSPAYFCGGSDTLALYVNLGAATTAPVIQLEGSEDNLNFYSIAGTALTTTANLTVYQSTPNALVKFVRARVSTAGSAATLGYIEIKALGR